MPRLMTYNVHGCVGTDGRLDIGRIAAVIGQSRPDIVALQELDVGRARSGRVDQAHAIATRLGMNFHFNSAFEVEEEQYGDAILTPLPHRLVRSGPLPTLPRTRLERRGALWVEVEAEGGRLQVINTHLGLVPLEQRRQTACLTSEDWLGAPACRDDPVVVLGDFNATSRYAAYRQLAARLRDVQLGPSNARHKRPLRTFPSRMPVIRIDHMFLSASLEVLGVEVPDHPLARVASDHLPLVADLKLARHFV